MSHNFFTLFSQNPKGLNINVPARVTSKAFAYYRLFPAIVKKQLLECGLLYGAHSENAVFTINEELYVISSSISITLKILSLPMTHHCAVQGSGFNLSGFLLFYFWV